MSAELLRRAAEKLRTRSKGVTNFPPPWHSRHLSGADWAVEYATDHPQAGHLAVVADYGGMLLADYMATMHPGVAFAVADLLDSLGAAARRVEATGSRISEDGQLSEDTRHALRIARAVLGDEA